MNRLLSGLFLAILCGLTFSTERASAADSTKNRIRIRKKSHLSRQAPEESEEYNAERMELLAVKRRNLILDIRRFIRDARDADQKAELNLRLGGLYMEDYYSGLAKAQVVYDRQLKEYNANKKGRRQPKFDNSEALGSLDKARAIYRDLVQRYPRHPRRDEMLYFLALANLDRGQTQEGMSYFARLTQETPGSKYVNDALVQLGDHYFDSNKFKDAEIYFDKIIAKKYRPLLAYAVYKKAWCAYNQQRTREALQNFKWVVSNEETEDVGAPVKIKGEALKDITLPFVDLRLLDDSIAFFRAQGDPHTRKGFETMAQLYFEAGEYRSAIILNEQLLAMDANYQKNPTYDISIVDALKLKGDQQGSINRLFSRLPAYMENSNWYELNAQNPGVVKEAQGAFEETARKYAFQFHAEGQKTKNEALYNIARQLYAKYIEYFPTSAHAAKVRFYLAEILYKQGQYLSAADNYFLVYKDVGAGALRLDGIRYALASLDRKLNEDRKKAGLGVISSKSTSKLKEKEDTSLELLPYAEAETKFIDISDEYLTKFPTQKDAADVLYEQAYLHYTHHELSKAYKSFWDLVQKYPKHDTAYASAGLILDILNRRKDFPKLIAACKKFLEPGIFQGKPAFRAEVSDVLRKAELKKIQLVEEKGDFKEAADQYIEYTKAYGHQDDQLFEKALYNASVDYSKAGSLMLAVETQEKFLRRFPKSSYRENMFLQVAKTYENLASLDRAATYFEAFATNYPKNAAAPTALRLAGLYYWGSGNIRKAEAVMLTYLRNGHKDTKAVEKDLLSLYDSAGALEKTLQYYLAARAQRGLPLSQYVAYSVKIAELQAQHGGGRAQIKTMEEALKVANRSTREITATPAGVEALSKLYFWVAKQKVDYFTSIKLALPQRTMEANLQKKLALMKELDKDFQRIVSLGSAEWGLASIYQTAAIYRHMAQAVMQAPVPAELTAEQIELYRGELTKQMIKPFNEKALQFATQCLDKSQEFNLLSSWTPRCYSMASELSPDHFPIARTFYLPALQTALMMPTKNESKIPIGSVKIFAYPFYSSGLFRAAPERSLAAQTTVPALYEGSRSSGDLPGVIPTPINYGALNEERQAQIKSEFESEKPADSRKGGSFAYLNLMRVVAPQRAVPLIVSAIQKDPANQALHNLLALTYLESGNLPAAKVTWLAMVARGVKNAALWNNLGIVANLEGNEMAAMDYFHEASLMDAPREALVNLGFLALKYRNGFEAKKHFEKALAIEKDDAAAQVGMAIAQLQNREMDNAKDGLLELTKKYKRDPYARLSLGYFLMDVEKESELARKVLSEYMEQQPGEDILFRQAVQETKHQPTADGSLPGIE